MFGGCLPVDDRTTVSPSLNRKGNLADKGNGNAEKRIEKEERQISALLLPAFFIRRNITCAELLVILDIKMQRKFY